MNFQYERGFAGTWNQGELKKIQWRNNQWIFYQSGEILRWKLKVFASYVKMNVKFSWKIYIFKKGIS